MYRFLLIVLTIPTFVHGQQLRHRNIESTDTTLESNLNTGHWNQFDLSSEIDSLQSLQSPDTVLLKQLRSLSSQLDSLKKPGLSTDSIKLNQRVVALQEKANGLLSKSNKQIPPIPSGIPSLDNPLGVPALPSIEGLQLPSGQLNLPDTKVARPTEIPQPGELKGVGEVTHLQEKLSPVNEITSKAQGYQDDLSNLKTGNLDKVQQLPESLESKVDELDEVNALKEQVAAAKVLKAKWQDPEVMKEEALNKAKETTINHFAGHEEELQAAMDKLSKLKAKFPDTEGVLDLFAKRQHPMKGKPLIERFLPGLAFQFQKQQSFWLDLNPYVGFKISGRFIAGLGWNERIAYNFDERDWDRSNRIYGPRSYLQFKLKGSFFLKADAEVMNAPSKSRFLNLPSDVHDRAWVWSYFGGVKKDFQLSKTFKWTMQALYNIYNPGNRSPYTSRFNVRFGVELPVHKKNKQERLQQRP